MAKVTSVPKQIQNRTEVGQDLIQKSLELHCHPKFKYLAQEQEVGAWLVVIQMQ